MKKKKTFGNINFFFVVIVIWVILDIFDMHHCSNLLAFLFHLPGVDTDNTLSMVKYKLLLYKFHLMTSLRYQVRPPSFSPSLTHVQSAWGKDSDREIERER